MTNNNKQNQNLRTAANDLFPEPQVPVEFKDLLEVFNGNATKLAEQVRDILEDQSGDLAIRTITHLLVARHQQKFKLEALQADNDRLQKSLITDTLTGLWNKTRVMEELTRQYVDRNDRRHAHGENHILYIDLVGFKNINDEQGHDAGDEALRKVAVVMIQKTRRNDIVARLHGDEFAILLFGLSEKEAKQKARDITEALKDIEVTYNGMTFNLPGANIGHAMLDPHLPPDENLKAADTKMYITKAANGGSGRKPNLA